jgi:CheY-like chemotaxis protein
VTLKAIHVLVVEDDALLHDLLQEPLEDGGFAVTLTLDGEEAIAALEAPDLVWCAVVTDIRLGRNKPTGWDVAKRARELNPSIPVVYMTGDSGADWSANGVPNSVMLNKPFAPVQIVTAVARLLNADGGPKV